MATQDKAFKDEQKAQLKRRPQIQQDTYAEIIRLLNLAQADIKTTLAGAPTEYQQFYLPQMQQEIKRVLAQFGDQAGTVAANGSTQSWKAGIDLVDKPIIAANILITAMLPRINTDILTAMRSFLTEKIKGVSTDLIDKINTQLGLTAIGAQSTGDAIKAVEAILESGGRKRALTIVRTELGRAYSVAAQARRMQAVEVLPGLQKQWRRSGKLHSRREHDYIDGQIQDVDKPFHVGGYLLMQPRDPAGPASETINCGCEALSVMKHWKVVNPGRKAFTEQEKANSPHKADMEAAFKAMGK